MKLNIKLRNLVEEDMAFIEKVYASTRMEEVAQTGWSKEEQVNFLKQQFSFQHTHYQQNYSDAAFDIILIDGVESGRLYLQEKRKEKDIRIVDIALLPSCRDRGAGTQLMETIFARARKKKFKVSIHVEHNNRAMNWYKRMGFSKVSEAGIYHLMEWIP